MCLNLSISQQVTLTVGVKGLSLQVSIMISKYYIDKFSGDNNFRFWKATMQEILIQQKCIGVFESLEEKTEMVDKSKSIIILCLVDKVLSPVHKTTMEMWCKLELLYMIKLLAYMLYMKQQLCWSMYL